jgi:hypothetical protein
LFRFVIAFIALVAASSTALAQNNLMPATAGASATKVSRTIGFTALGTYGNEGELRLVDVKLDADSDGDGANDQGVLELACNGGDIVTGRLRIGESVADRPKLKALQAKGASPLASGKTFKGSWDAREVAKANMTSAPIPLTLAANAPDVCA